MFDKKLILGFMRVHILHHASEENGVYGSWMLDELKEHGYDISPGTLYPILHEMKEQGLLSVIDKTVGGKIRKVYRTTQKGDRTLEQMKGSIRELSKEVLD